MMIGRGAVALILTVGLIFPAWARTPEPPRGTPAVIGTLASGEEIEVRGSFLLPGGTVYAGEVVSAGPKSGASILLTNGANLQLGPDSQARLVRDTEAIQVELRRGRAVFRSMPGAQVEARVADATIRATGTEPTVAIVAMLSPSVVLVAAERGQLTVRTAQDNRSLNVGPGESVELRMAIASPQAGAAAGKVLTPLTVAAAGAALGGIVALTAWRLLQERELSAQTRRDLVSPFKIPQ